MTAPSILGSRGIVGTAGRGLCWEVRYRCSALKLDGVGDFASLFALREYKGLDLEWRSKVTTSIDILTVS